MNLQGIAVVPAVEAQSTWAPEARITGAKACSFAARKRTSSSPLIGQTMAPFSA